MHFEIVKGETEHITFSGKKSRKPTILMRVRTRSGGSVSLSRKAALLGLTLAFCQVLDGLLTYLGLRLLGVEMEGNNFLRELMHAYGMVPILFVAKSSAIFLAGILMFNAHRRKWIRPIILFLAVIYMALAVVPWVVVISNSRAIIGVS
jgi:uncharacterized membrane protein